MTLNETCFTQFPNPNHYIYIYIYIYHLAISITDIFASSQLITKVPLLGNVKIKIQ